MSLTRGLPPRDPQSFLSDDSRCLQHPKTYACDVSKSATDFVLKDRTLEDGCQKKKTILNGWPHSITRHQETTRNRAAFAVAPILYILMLVGVAGGALFSGYSQVLRSSAIATNTITTKTDLSGASTTLAALSELSVDQSVFCPPRSNAGAGGQCAAAPAKMDLFSEIPPADTSRLPSNYALADTTGTPAEVGVLKASSGLKQLDPWGRYYVYCRWENTRANPGDPAMRLIGAGADGKLDTKCGDVTANNDDQISSINVGTAIDRSAVWQATGTGDVQYGAAGSRVKVSADGTIEAVRLVLKETATIEGGLNLLNPLPVSSGGTGASEAGQARTNLGAGVVGSNLFVSSTATQARTTLGATAMGDYLFASSTGDATIAATVRSTLLGASTVGSSVFTAATATAARTSLGGGILGSNLFTALDQPKAWEILGFTGTLAPTLDIHINGIAGSVNASGIIGVVAIAQGGTGGNSAIQARENLGAHDASNLTTGSLPVDRLAPESITSGKLSQTGVVPGAYNWGTVDAAGRVLLANNVVSTGLTDGAGDQILATASNGGNLLFYTASQLRMVLDSAGRLGIGIATPTEKLQVADGNIMISGSPTTSRGLFFATGTDLKRWQIEANSANETGSTTGSNFAINSYNDDGTARANVLTINRATGNAAFSGSVSATGGFIGNLTGNVTGNLTGDVTGNITGGVVGTLGLNDGAVGTPSLYFVNNTNMGLYRPVDSTMAFVTAGVEALRLTATQSIGIGTASPAQKLDVAGNLNLVTSTNALYIGNVKFLHQVAGDTTSLGLGANTLTATTATNMQNVAVGESALRNAQTYETTAIGFNALSSVSTGGANTAIGNNALRNTTGSQNTGVGRWVMLVNSSGSENTAIGVSSMKNNSSGSKNTAVGKWSLFSNTTGSSNTVVGYSALDNETETGTFTGSFNTILGTRVGSTTLVQGTGSRNILIGTGTAVDTPTSNTNDWLNIGSVIYGNLATGAVGIGSATINTGVSLDIGGRTDSVLLPRGTQAQRPSGLIGMLRYNTETSAVEAYQGAVPGWTALGTTVTSGSNVPVNLGPSTATANPAREGEPNTGLFSPATGVVAITNLGTESLRLTATGSLGLGTTTPAQKLDVAGNLNLTATSNALYIANNKILHHPAGDVSSLALGVSTLIVQTSTNLGNIAIGQNALSSVATGFHNTAVGFGVLRYTVSSYNTAVGYTSLYANTTGSMNVGVGTSALGSNLTGNFNVGLGHAALYSNTTGTWNTAVGANALEQNRTGWGNTAIGQQALSSLRSGQNNVVVGVQALFSSSASNFTGIHNIVLGPTVASTTLVQGSGSRNILIGTSSAVDTPTADTNDWLNIGNTVYGNLATGSVGIGSATINSGVSLDIGGRTDSVLLPRGTQAQRPSGLIGMLRYNTETSAVEAYQGAVPGWTALGTTVTSGSNVPVNLGPSTATANPAREGEPNTGLFSPATGVVAITNLGTESLRLTATGSLGLGTTTPAQKLDVAGNLNLTATSNALYIANNKILHHPAGDVHSIAIGSNALSTQTATNLYNVAVGHLALNSTTTGAYNTAVGESALKLNTTGGGNNAFGVGALALNTTGYSNAAFGNYALTSNTTGAENTALGNSALQGNTTGVYNTAVGRTTLSSNSGNYNTALGAFALRGTATYSITGHYNLALGYGALYGTTANISGSQNVVVGPLVATATLTSGSRNILIGTSSAVDTPISSTNDWLNIGNTIKLDMSLGTALQNPAQDSTSLAVGQGALLAMQTGTSLYNTAVGVESLKMVTTGAGNVAIGSRVLAHVATGMFNVGIGHDALYGSQGESNIGIGHATLYDFGEGSHNVAIGEEALMHNTSGSANAAIGFLSQYNNLTGTLNASFGSNALRNNTTGNHNTAMGAAALQNNTTGNLNTALGYGAYHNTATSSTGSNNLVLGSFVGASLISGSRNILIGTSSAVDTPTAATNDWLNIGSVIYGNLATGSVGIGSATINTGVSLDLGTRTDSVLLPKGTDANRPTPITGMIRYNTTSNAMEVYQGATPAWVALTTGATAGSFMYLGTSTATASPARSGELTTGLFSPATGVVAVTSLGTEALRVTATASIGIGTASPAQRLDVAGNINLSSASNALYIGNTKILHQPAGDTTSIALGTNAALSQTSTYQYNTAIGVDALKNNLIGTYNTAVGYQVLMTSTGAGYNVGIGYQALSGNRTGAYNVAVGLAALNSNTTGASNVAIGYGAGRNQTTGGSNTVVGAGSLYYTTTGSYNTVVGNHAFVSNTGGIYNTAIGDNALSGATGSYNIGLGPQSLNSASGNKNIAVGYRALYTTTTGHSNIAIGQDSTYLNTGGFENLAIGLNSLYYNLVGDNNTAIGMYALYNNKGSFNTAIGSKALYMTISGTNNLGLGYQVGSKTLTTGSNNILIGTSSLVDTTASNSSNQLNIGNTLYGNLATGSVGIGSPTINTGASLDLSSRTDSLLLPTGTDGQRPTGIAGMIRYNTTSNALEVYQGASPTWVALAAASTASGTSYLGESTATAGPARTGEPNTGLFSPATGIVAVTNLGTEALRITATGSLGLGATTPAQRLDVSGNINVSAITNAYYIANTKILHQPASDTTSIAIGPSALVAQTTTNNSNTAIGAKALQYNTGLGGNTAIGAESMASITFGYSNTAIGYYALAAEQSGGYNVAVGQHALGAMKGEGNVGIGFQALSEYRNEISTGNYNIGIGFRVGCLTPKTGSNNILIGTSCAVDVPTLSTSNWLNIGNTVYGNLATGAVGIGSPTINTGVSLDVGGRTDSILLPKGTDAQRPTAITGMIRYNTTSNALEVYQGASPAWVAFGASGGTLGTAASSASPYRTGETNTGFFSPDTGVVAVTSLGTESLRVTATGSLGLGVVNPAQRLDVSGNINVSAITNAYYIANTKILHQPASDTTSFALGVNALTSQTTTGLGNTALGINTLSQVTTGQFNTAVGSGALTITTTGYGNTAVGTYALTSNTTGYLNTAHGASALHDNGTGYMNTALGFEALYKTTTGVANTAVGVNAAHENTTGLSNVSIGANALYANTTGYYNTVVGTNAAYNQTATFSGASNTIIGNAVASTTLATGSNNILIGTSSLVDTPAASTSNFLNIGNTLNADMVAQTMGIHLGTTAASYPIEVGNTTSNGNGAYLSAAGVWTNASDRRSKENIRPIHYGLDTLMKLTPVAYEMKNTGDKQIGFIAQDVAALVPEVTNISRSGWYGLSYGNLLAVSVKAQQEMKTTQDDHATRIAALEQENKKLRAELAAAKETGTTRQTTSTEKSPELKTLEDRLTLITTIGGALALVLIGGMGAGVYVLRRRNTP